MSITRRFAVTGAVVAVAISGLAACTSPNSAEGGGDAKTIALLLPESKTTRYESFDRPIFEKTVKKECADCVVKYYNADQDEAKQAQQMETALSAGATDHEAQVAIVDWLIAQSGGADGPAAMA